MSEDYTAVDSNVTNKYGLNLREIGEILAKWGPTVLQLVIKGLKEGISLQLIKELLDTFGPLVLELVVDKKFKKVNVLESAVNELDKNRYVGAFKLTSAGLIEGERVTDFEDSSLIVQLLEKLLPKLIETYGPLILKWLTELFIQKLQDPLYRPTISDMFKTTLSELFDQE